MLATDVHLPSTTVEATAGADKLPRANVTPAVNLRKRVIIITPDDMSPNHMLRLVPLLQYFCRYHTEVIFEISLTIILRLAIYAAMSTSGPPKA